MLNLNAHKRWNDLYDWEKVFLSVFDLTGIPKRECVISLLKTADRDEAMFLLDVIKKALEERRKEALRKPTTPSIC